MYENLEEYQENNLYTFQDCKISCAGMIYARENPKFGEPKPELELVGATYPFGYLPREEDRTDEKYMWYLEDFFWYSKDFDGEYRFGPTHSGGYSFGPSYRNPTKYVEKSLISKLWKGITTESLYKEFKYLSESVGISYEVGKPGNTIDSKEKINCLTSKVEATTGTYLIVHPLNTNAIAKTELSNLEFCDKFLLIDSTLKEVKELNKYYPQYVKSVEKYFDSAEFTKVLFESNIAK